MYEAFLEIADTILLTEIHDTYDGDVFFPKFEHLYHEVDRDSSQSEFDWVTYRRNR